MWSSEGLKAAVFALQKQSKLSEEALAEAQLLINNSRKRQNDLEYELARAWEEIERVELELQQQHTAHTAAMQQVEGQLLHSDQVHKSPSTCSLASFWQSVPF